MTTMQQLVVGIFEDQAQAELAIDELVRAGFDRDQIDFAGPRPTALTGGILEQIKSLFTGQDVSTAWLYHDLMAMGVPPEETRYYQSEFEAGRSLVAIHGTVGIQMASLILARNGGYGANRSAAQSADYDQRTGTQEPPREDVNTEPRNDGYAANQSIAQSANEDQMTGEQKSTQENVNQESAPENINQEQAPENLKQEPPSADVEQEHDSGMASMEPPASTI